MGRTFQFECPHCRYQARVSGGADGGLNCSIHTIYCRDCRELFDVYLRIRKKLSTEAPAKERPRQGLLSAGSSIPPVSLIEEPWPEFQRTRTRRPARQTVWEDKKAECPVSAIHRVQLWQEPGRCPRCGNFMEKNVFPYRRWD